MKLKRTVKHYVEYFLLISITFILRLFPLSLNLLFAQNLGKFLYFINKKHRLRALDNLKHAFPNKSEKKRNEILKKVYINLCKVYFEFLYLPLLNNRYLKKKVSIVGKEHLVKALKQNKGIVAVTGHMDNWELLGAIMVKSGFPLDALFHPMKNPHSNDFINRIRMKTGMGLIPIKNSLRASLKALKNNHVLGLIADQDAGGDGVFVDFFNRPASTYKGPAFFAIRTGAPMLFFTLIRGKKDTHTLYISKPLPVRITGDMDIDIHYNTKLWSDFLEKKIRQYPDQWFWVHRRWHSKIK